MRYEINVSRRGRHFFATSERSIRTEEELVVVWVALIEKFPASEGYQVTATSTEETGRFLNLGEFIGGVRA